MSIKTIKPLALDSTLNEVVTGVNGVSTANDKIATAINSIADVMKSQAGNKVYNKSSSEFTTLDPNTTVIITDDPCSSLNFTINTSDATSSEYGVEYRLLVKVGDGFSLNASTSDGRTILYNGGTAPTFNSGSIYEINYSPFGNMLWNGSFILGCVCGEYKQA